MSSFHIIFFDLLTNSINHITPNKEFIKRIDTNPLGTNGYSEEIGKLYFENKGWKVIDLYKTKKSPIGFPDLKIELNGVVRYVEMKLIPDKLDFEQFNWLVKLRGIVGFVFPNSEASTEFDDKKEIEY